MSRSEDSYRTDLINAINTKLPSPYKAYDSQMIGFDKPYHRIKSLKKFRREFDIIITDERFVTDKKLRHPALIFIAIETKALGSECNGIEKVDEYFSVFPVLSYAFSTNFDNKIYCKARGKPKEAIELKSTDMKAKHIEIAEIIKIGIDTVISMLIWMFINPSGLHFPNRFNVPSISECDGDQMNQSMAQFMKKMADIDTAPIEKDALQIAEAKLNEQREYIANASRYFKDREKN